MKPILGSSIIILLGLFVAMPVCAAEREKQLPEAVQTILDKAESYELFSLDPARDGEKPKDGFHGWKVLGSTAVKDKDTKKKSLEAVYKGISENKGMAAKCFTPRHGIRAKHDGKTVDLVICFECFQIQVFVDDKNAEGVLTARSPEPALDAILKEAKVELAPKPK